MKSASILQANASATSTPARVTVVGCGHVGLVLAAGLAHLGHTVVGLDRDTDLVKQLNLGRVSLMEPGLADLVASNLGRRLCFTCSPEEAMSGAEIVFFCVTTAGVDHGSVDLNELRGAIKRAASALAPGAAPLLVVKSTAPVGTAEALKRLLPAGVTLAVNPEFLREGTAVQDFFTPTRTVIGAETSEDAERLKRLFAPLDAPVLVTDLRTAEMSKFAANVFLAARISLVNELAGICHRLGVEVDTVAGSLAFDPRIGRGYMTPGIGFGGSCLPKDLASLLLTAREAGLQPSMLQAIAATNACAAEAAVKAIEAALGGLERRRIAVWGLTFKGGTNDLRDSPALAIVRSLQVRGAHIAAYDPSLSAERNELEFAIHDDPVAASRGADALAILSDWAPFREADFGVVRREMAGRYVFDGRNLLDRAAVEGAGLIYEGVGRPRKRPAKGASTCEC